jgi:hypothetical protein
MTGFYAERLVEQAIETADDYMEVIMCIGCEAEEPQHYRKAVASLRRRFHDHDATVAYLVGKAPLHEYLRRGWERLREEPRPWPPTEE